MTFWCPGLIGIANRINKAVFRKEGSLVASVPVSQILGDTTSLALYPRTSQYQISNRAMINRAYGVAVFNLVKPIRIPFQLVGNSTPFITLPYTSQVLSRLWHST